MEIDSIRGGICSDGLQDAFAMGLGITHRAMRCVSVDYFSYRLYSLQNY